MSFKSVNDIDWSDPVAANRQLRQQLKMLEAQEQGGHGEGSRGGRLQYDNDENYDEWAPIDEERLRVPVKKRPEQHSSGTRERVNKTFNNKQCREIDAANRNLVHRLSSVHKKPSSYAPAPRRQIRGSATINRNRKQEQIARDNARIANRLRNISGSKSIKKTSSGSRKKKVGTRRPKTLAHPEWQS